MGRGLMGRGFRATGPMSRLVFRLVVTSARARPRFAGLRLSELSAACDHPLPLPALPKLVRESLRALREQAHALDLVLIARHDVEPSTLEIRVGDAKSGLGGDVRRLRGFDSGDMRTPRGEVYDLRGRAHRHRSAQRREGAGCVRVRDLT